MSLFYKFAFTTGNELVMFLLSSIYGIDGRMGGLGVDKQCR